MDTADYLRQFEQPWREGFLARALTLPGRWPELVRRPVLGIKDQVERAQLSQELIQTLHGSDEITRQAVAEVFFPQFPDVARRTLEALLTRHTYTQGYARRAFRAPGHLLQAEKAVAWLWNTFAITRAYPQDLEWFAVHAGLMSAWESHGLGYLLGQAISDGDEAVFAVLRDTAGSQHPIARMGRHVPAALLSSTREDAWGLAERLLLAAQRQEGLRQVILETVDEASPEAFVRMLRLILEEDLLRFAAALRAADVWFGLNYDVEQLKVVRGLLTNALNFLDDPASAAEAVRGGLGVQVYLALYTLGMRDAQAAAGLARPLLTDPDPERRMAAAQFLEASALWSAEERAALLGDADLRVAALADQGVSHWSTDPHPYLSFEAYLNYAQRLSTEASHEPLLFPWLGHVPARSTSMDALPGLLGERPVSLLAPYLSQMTHWGRQAVVARIRKQTESIEGQPVPVLDAVTRDLLLTLLQDRNSDVSQQAVWAMAALTPNPEELGVLHTLLRRKSADLRRGLIRLLARDPEQGQRSAYTLLAGSNTEQRQAGLQLLQEVGGTPPQGFTPKNVSEATLLARLTQPGEQLSLDNGLGLFDPADLTPPGTVQARERDYPQEVQRGAALLRSLDELVQRHRETPLVGVGYDGEETLLLANVSRWMLRPNSDGVMPLGELWDGWWQTRPDPQEGDLTRLQWVLGHYVARKGTTATELDAELVEIASELAELATLLGEDPEDLVPDAELDAEERQERQQEISTAQQRQALRQATLHRTLGPLVSLWLEHADLLHAIVKYLDGQFHGSTDTDLALDAWETALSYLPTDAEMVVDTVYSWRSEDPRDLLGGLRISPGQANDEQFQQLWAIRRYEDRAFKRLPRRRGDVNSLLRAYALELAGRADLLDQLIGARDKGGSFDDLRLYTQRKLRDGLPQHPDWTEAVGAVRSKVLDVEVTRGDLETSATLPALALQSVQSAALTLRLLAGMGKNPLRRGYQGRNESKDVTFSHLIRVSFPQSGDTPATFAQQARTLGLSQTRLLDLAMFAPQWANIVADAVGWKGLQSGVYWLHAHTKESNWSVPQDIRDSWEAEISERTPLSADQLVGGAVDVAWFRAMHKVLGHEHFRALLDAAKYASSSGGHKRAELFAHALSGDLKEDELQTRITGKRNQDAVRALGLLPLSRGKGKAAQELERRYRLLSQFRKEARQWGAQRQASERLAADIGLQNLARTAGYTDPQRLMWAMEAKLAPDWRAEVNVDGVQVGITMTPEGEAALVVRRGEKVLKTLPSALRKHPEVVSLRDALKELEGTRSRMRAALEEAMIRGDHFSAAEVRDLSGHPVIAPMLRSLVWSLNEEHLGWWEGEMLRTSVGGQPIDHQALRLAHPHDLYQSGQWPDLQQQVMDSGMVQPFKQVFREYYPLTSAEQGARRSARYAGQHVQPGKAAALFKARGWVAVPDEGVRKTYHQEGINVWVDTSLGYGTPNEVEGAELRAVYFVARDATQTGSPEPLLLSEVPPRLLSETLRDLDLVVGVAHVGGVDPEATQSTIEMRTDLLRETLRLLQLKNVRLEHDHALIEGTYSRYTVHLGSGIVHRMPGGALCIIPVHNQHQGRLFLPFADPDPRTAEIVSKVILLADDRNIQDPTILEQLR